MCYQKLKAPLKPHLVLNLCKITLLDVRYVSDKNVDNE